MSQYTYINIATRLPDEFYNTINLSGLKRQYKLSDGRTVLYYRLGGHCADEIADQITENEDLIYTTPMNKAEEGEKIAEIVISYFEDTGNSHTVSLYTVYAFQSIEKITTKKISETSEDSDEKVCQLVEDSFDYRPDVTL